MAVSKQEISAPSYSSKLQDQANTLLRRLEAAQGMQDCLDIFHVVLATAANDSMAARWRGSY